MEDQEADFQKLREMIKDMDFCMLTTVDENNDLHSRPMSLNDEVDQDGNLWFFTNGSSHKVSELKRTPKCNVSFADPDSTGTCQLRAQPNLSKIKPRLKNSGSRSLKRGFPKAQTNQI